MSRLKSGRWRLILLQRLRGQVAVGFIAFMALAVLLTSATVNLGEVARLKTATANAADAGALAGASWVASGENEMSLIAELMWMNIVIAQIYLALPFCRRIKLSGAGEGIPEGGWIVGVGAAGLLAGTVWLLNEALTRTANESMQDAWTVAKADTLFKTFDNLLIDDAGNSQAREAMADIRADYELTKTVPTSVRLEWDRPGDDSEEVSWISIDTQFPANPPELFTSRHRLWWFIWSPPIWLFFFCCCWPAFGRNRIPKVDLLVPVIDATLRTVRATRPGRPTKFLGAAWSYAIGPFLAIMTNTVWRSWGKCTGTWFESNTCFPIPLLIDTRKPGGIRHGGPGPLQRITVTVAEHREDRTVMPFWTMRYPDRVVSSAISGYSSAKVSYAPNATSLAQLVEVR